MDIADQLRRYIDRSDLTYAEIADQADIHKSNLSRFVDGTRGLRLDAVARLCAVLKVKLVAHG